VSYVLKATDPVQYSHIGTDVYWSGAAWKQGQNTAKRYSSREEAKRPMGTRYRIVKLGSASRRVAELEARLVSANWFGSDGWEAQRALHAMNTAIQQRDEALAKLSKAEGDLAVEHAVRLGTAATLAELRDKLHRLLACQ
jgi:hypothetical protein